MDVWKVLAETSTFHLNAIEHVQKGSCFGEFELGNAGSETDVELTDRRRKDSTAGNDFQWWKYLCGCIKQKQPILAVILWDPQKWFKVKSADGCWHLNVFHQAPGDSASIPVSSVCVLSLLAASPVFVWATFSAQVFVDKKVTEVSVFYAWLRIHNKTVQHPLCDKLLFLCLIIYPAHNTYFAYGYLHRQRPSLSITSAESSSGVEIVSHQRLCDSLDAHVWPRTAQKRWIYNSHLNISSYTIAMDSRVHVSGRI